MFASETDCWKRMLVGDENAFLRIYNTHYPALFRYGFCLSKDKELTKDAIQELFLELWTRRSRTTKNVGDLQSYLFTWLRRKISRMVSGLAKNRNKKNGFHPSILEEPSYEELLIAFQTNEWEKAMLQHALTHLTRKQLELIKLKYFDNLSYTQIAAQTSLTSRTIYNTIHEALRRLKANSGVAV